jgi:hypothetical protein
LTNFTATHNLLSVPVHILIRGLKWRQIFMAKSAHLSKIESIRNYLFMENWEGNRFLRFHMLGLLMYSSLYVFNIFFQCLWLQEYSKLQSLTDVSWSEDVAILVKDIKVSVLKRHLKQISDAYSRISFTSLCEMLILDARQTVEGNRLVLFSFIAAYRSRSHPFKIMFNELNT